MKLVMSMHCRSVPLKGPWTHTKGGFYHEESFATLPGVVNHHNAHLKLDLTEKEVGDLTKYLKSI
jgi:hypothetical protein